MAQFNLVWFNTAVIINPNSSGQKVSHRQKSIGGAYFSTGYTPVNNLPKTASTIQSPVLANNIVWEFKVECLCTEGGPTINDNGNQEGLKFSCLTPSLSYTTNSATIVLNVTGLDITSATFTLKKVSDNSVVSGPTTVARVGAGISHTVMGLNPGTGYYWEYIMYAIVNGSQIQSNDANQINASCFSVNFTTNEDVCPPVTNANITSIDIT